MGPIIFELWVIETENWVTETLKPNRLLMFSLGRFDFESWCYLVIKPCLTVWVQPTCIVKAHSWACSKSLPCKFFPFNGKWPKHWVVWLLNEKCSRVSFWFNAKAEQVCETRWREKKEKKQRPFGLVECWSKKQRASFSQCVWVPERAKHKEIFSHFERCNLCEEIERNTVRVWESEKKNETFFFA